LIWFFPKPIEEEVPWLPFIDTLNYMILHFLLASAQASSFYIKPFSEFTQEATNIAYGTISNIHVENSISSSGAKIIYTYASLDVKEVLKGAIHEHTILIRKVGGTKDGFTIEIPGSPEFKDGEETVLFMSAQKEDQSYEVTGLELGKYGIEEKDGQATLTGGIFNYVKQDEHNLAESQPENQHPWTLKGLRALVEKQGGKDAPPKVASTPPQTVNAAGSPVTAVTPPGITKNTLSSETKSSLTTHDESSETNPFIFLLYGVLGIGLAFSLFFLFRKR